ncbi:MAG: hypothetical protein HYV94_16105 [Candidatus Rokubacteria bacterium]|nr:hypothetical protein [Candidatus Rokubacteria bacterium]
MAPRWRSRIPEGLHLAVGQPELELEALADAVPRTGPAGRVGQDRPGAEQDGGEGEGDEGTVPIVSFDGRAPGGIRPLERPAEPA